MLDSQTISHPQPRILIVGQALARVTLVMISENGLAVDVVADKATLIARLATGLVDLVILDVTMMGEYGLQLCNRLTRAGQPVMIASSAAEDVDRILGLEMGADDYVDRDMSPREILARIRAILRGRAARRPCDRSEPCYQFHGLRYDALNRTVHWPSGATTCLSNSEASVLTSLLTHAGQVMSRDALKPAKKRGPASERSVDIRISRLRKKLGQAGSDVIQAIRNEGYVIKADVTRYPGFAGPAPTA